MSSISEKLWELEENTTIHLKRRRAFLARANLRRRLLTCLTLLALTLLLGLEIFTPPHLPDLLDVSLSELQAGLQNGYFTSQDLVSAYLARIEEVNFRGPSLHAVIEMNPWALTQASALDWERALSGPRSKLHGIPIIVKDNIATLSQEEMNTTAGSWALLGSKVPGDAGVVDKLRKAGAIILGKSNLSEFSHARGNLASGWSGRGGQCTSPYYPMADPCGSSAGSGVVSALGLAAASLGTETDGSIVCPSQKNNLVGVKPTVGLTSRWGVIPISEHQDTVGPMTRWVSDAALILGIIAGPDGRDNYTLSAPPVPDYRKALDPGALRGARLGVPRKMFLELEYTDVDPYVHVVFEQAIHVLRQLGAVIVDPADLPSAYEIANSTREQLVGLTDMKVDLNKYLDTLAEVPTGVRTLEDIIRWNDDHPELEKPENYTDQQGLVAAQATKGYDAVYYRVLEEDYRMGREEGIDYALKTFELDALILPSTAGYPIITVPLGFYPQNTTIKSSGPVTVYPAPGVPFGLSFLGTAWSEYDLMGYAYAYEQKTRTRSAGKPYVVPRAQLGDFVCSARGRGRRVLLGIATSLFWPARWCAAHSNFEVGFDTRTTP
ncbi:amidase signature enzyme [Dacryopinax primogenitus]|uniref:Amidase signature enzyme n=1 Tax=Dacryopinax primogenitus (strain DJM 731) TaxID=1858805 RepID=M5FTE2_DACPD|nr:amidase signature enzyme [Dacryopinax primogenitus]EJU00901.1 amidase signature enzyme [Dacryopinax primogenitus]